MNACVSGVASRLEAAFERIRRERMEDLPILNRKLRVEAVGFRNWREYSVGVLITPWFMNLILLGGGIDSGDDCSVDFPSGRYDFTCAEVQEVGRYFSCSLFSPMSGFRDQAEAAATAAAVLERVMDKAPDALAGKGAICRRDMLRGRIRARTDPNQ